MIDKYILVSFEHRNGFKIENKQTYNDNKQYFSLVDNELLEPIASKEAAIYSSANTFTC